MPPKKTLRSSPYFRKKPKSATFSLLTSPRIFAIVALIFILLILIPLAKNYSRKRLIEKEIAEISKEIEEFEAKNNELQDIASYLQSEQSVEEQARLNMGMRKPGESVAVVQGEFSNLINNTLESSEPVSNWKKWQRYFFN